MERWGSRVGENEIERGIKMLNFSKGECCVGVCRRDGVERWGSRVGENEIERGISIF